MYIFITAFELVKEEISKREIFKDRIVDVLIKTR
jgi:hypothetical protein